MIQRRLLRGTVYVEIPIDWEDGGDWGWDDNMPPPVPLNQVLEELVGKAVVKDSYPRLRDSDVTVEASDVVLDELEAVADRAGKV